MTMEGVDIIFVALRQLNSLKRVGFYHRTVENAILPVVTDFIRNNSKIKHLELGYPDLDGMCNVMERLAIGSSVKSLMIIGENIRNEANVQVELKRIGNLISRCNTLECLVLVKQNDMETLSSAPDEFIRGFERNTSLKEINIEWFSPESDPMNALKFFRLRNEKGPLMKEGPMDHSLMDQFENLLVNENNRGLSLVFEVLRERDDWFDKIERDGTRASRKRARHR